MNNLRGSLLIWVLSSAVVLLPGGILQFSFEIAAGSLYQVEYTEDLTVPIWTPLGLPQSAGVMPVTVQDDVTGRAQGFYRVRILP